MTRRLLLLAALAACGPRGATSDPHAPGQTHATPDAVAPTADARGDGELPPTPCAIRADGDALRFEQPGGAIRLAGAVTADEAGFRLAADIFCSSPPCPAPGRRDLVFFTQRPGAYAAVLPLDGGDLLNIDVVRR